MLTDDVEVPENGRGPVRLLPRQRLPFYADVAALADPWADERTSRVWIEGDLHAENFGTYTDGNGC
jgi:hypothetical protein